MADNVGYTPGTGATVAADEISGVLHQRVKVTLGTDGVNDGDISSSNPLPIIAPSGITISGTPNVAITNTPAVTISGTSNVNVTNASLPITPATGATFTTTSAIDQELIECLESIRSYAGSLNRSIGQVYPDSIGRVRILLDAISANLTLATVTTVSNVTTVSTVTGVTTVSTVTNMSQLGAQPAAETVYSSLRFAADSLRRNIQVT